MPNRDCVRISLLCFDGSSDRHGRFRRDVAAQMDRKTAVAEDQVHYDLV